MSITERISLEAHSGEAGEAKVAEGDLQTSDEAFKKVDDDSENLFDERYDVSEEGRESDADLGEDWDDGDCAHTRSGDELVAGGERRLR